MSSLQTVYPMTPISNNAFIALTSTSREFLVRKAFPTNRMYTKVYRIVHLPDFSAKLKCKHEYFFCYKIIKEQAIIKQSSTAWKLSHYFFSLTQFNQCLNICHYWLLITCNLNKSHANVITIAWPGNSYLRCTD